MVLKGLCRTAAALLALAGSGCGREFEGGGDLHARQVVLRREVQGLRQVAAKLERGESILAPTDVVVAIEESLVKDIISAQLPFVTDVDKYHLSLDEAAVKFSGSPTVSLRGTLNLLAYPSLLAQVNVIGALERIEVDSATSTLTARIAIDHLGIERAAGLEKYVSGPALDEAGRMIRLRIRDQLPPVQIPVDVQRTVELPAVTRGPIRIDGASLPLNVAVSQVVAARGTLWISVRFEAGVVVKTADAPAAGQTTAEEAGVSLAENEPAAATTPTAPSKAPAKGPGTEPES